MSYKEMFEEYANKICPYCKGECNKGITIIKDYKNKQEYAKCVDYQKDETKLVKYKIPLKVLAKRHRI